MTVAGKRKEVCWYHLTKSKEVKEAALEMLKNRRYQLALELGGNAGQGSEVEYAGRLRELAYLEGAFNQPADAYYKEVLKHAKSDAKS